VTQCTCLPSLIRILHTVIILNMLIRNLHNPSELLALIVYAIKNTKIPQGSLHILMLTVNLINVKNDNRLHAVLLT